ncbi:helix-turn-helix transcriptional regulator [Bradyrhizobium sp. Arg68]|uniref:helix-turn-helix domain-containing protein n=1 Tax=Bradyrhizobium ivorense TaxID=2511166 RepID=UPI001E5D2B72|nr:helix-turn-helix transcriptional regulator [Bradyrhizobium ivorense]MCC8937708.1 helix-turn-helix transcriptional regulator [Bradyrhizobium ivorense]
MWAEQLRAARAAIRWDQTQLAHSAGVSVETVKRLEGMTGVLRVRLDTLEKIRRALETGGVEFTDDVAPGIRLPLFVKDGETVGRDYRFDVRYRGRTFVVRVSQSLLDAYEEQRTPKQPAEGRLKRMTALIGPVIITALQAGRAPSDDDNVMRLAPRDFEAAQIDSSRTMFSSNGKKAIAYR